MSHVVIAGTLDEVLAARDARIRFILDRGTPPPAEQLTGQITITHQRDQQRVEVRTADLADDLRTLLAWSQTHNVELHRLHATEPTLAEVFHDVRATTTAEQATP